MLLAFTLRMHQIDNDSMWFDEGLTTLRASYPVSQLLINEYRIQDGSLRSTHPALYFLMVHFSNILLGQSDFSYRYPSTLLGIMLVPLVYQLARRVHDQKVAFLAMGLTAINPLQIFYAQEARMYTLVVLLGAAATYVLWQAFSTRHLWRWLILYSLLATAAFFTNYNAAFLIAVQAVFAAWILWSRGHRRVVLLGSGLGLVGLMLLPFLPIDIARPFMEAASGFRLGEYFGTLQEIIVGFSFGVTIPWDHWGTRLLGAGILTLLVAGIVSPHPERGGAWERRLYLSSYLLAAAMGWTFLSIFDPQLLRFRHVRHIMVGSPALLILVARGFVFLRQRPFLFLSVAGLAASLVGSAISLNALYNNPAIAKDDFRSLVRYIERHAGESDIVLYYSAEHLSLHTHYQSRPRLPYHSLPRLGDVAGPDTIDELQGLAGQYDRIWFMGSRPLERDKHGLVEQWLENNLSEIDRRNFHGPNAFVGVIAYSTYPLQPTDLPMDGLPLEIQIGEFPTLRGIRLGFNQPSSLPALWFDLFWQEENSLKGDLRLVFGIRDQDGYVWSESSHPFRWSSDDKSAEMKGLTRLSYDLPVRMGTPPGRYELLLKVWNAATEQVISDWQYLTTVQLAGSDSWPVKPELSLFNEFPLAGTRSSVDDLLETRHGIRQCPLSVRGNWPGRKCSSTTGSAARASLATS
jgi:4-amino-4-deoxy-L-arabinose transferase-like glycosyltransferase